MNSVEKKRKTTFWRLVGYRVNFFKYVESFEPGHRKATDDVTEIHCYNATFTSN